jgi:hypothetical protein
MGKTLGDMSPHFEDFVSRLYRVALILCKQKNEYIGVFLQMKICVWPNKLVNGEIDDNM